MSIEGQDDARSSKFLFLAGGVPITAHEIDGIMSESSTADRPDRTRRMTDEKNPIEFTLIMEMRDRVAMAFMRVWRSTREHIDSVLNYNDEAGDPVAIFNLVQVCPSKFEVSKLSIPDDPESVTVTWTLTADDCVQIL